MTRFGHLAVIGLLVPLVASCTGPSGPAGAEDGVNRMRVNDVRMDPRTESPVILLEEDEGAGRLLAIWIGPSEARSIALAIEGVPSPRPNSHDLIGKIVEKIDIRVSRIVITELRGGTYYAMLEIESAGQMVAIDSRPSDAIAVAMRIGAPVFATDDVLRKAGVLPEADDDEHALDTHWEHERELETLTH